MSYADTVLYPAPSVVINHTIRPDSSSSIALLFAPIWYALAPPSPFTFTTCCAGGAYTGGWICWPNPYGFRNGFWYWFMPSPPACIFA